MQKLLDLLLGWLSVFDRGPDPYEDAHLWAERMDVKLDEDDI
jgi:hypothetical protein